MEKRLHDAQATGCGVGDSGPYTRMWNGDMEWMHGKKVSAVPLAEFVEALHARPEFL